MKKLSNLIAFIAVVIGFVISLSLFRHVVGVLSPWFGLLIMFCLLGLIAFARPFYTLKLPRWLQRLRAWEVSGKRYPIMGVTAFGQLLRRTPLRYLNPAVYLNQHPGNIKAVQLQIESAEAAHLWAAVVLTPYIIFAGMHECWSTIAWLVMVQIAGNLYPTLHLRWVRGRLQRFVKKTSKFGDFPA